MLKLVLCLRYLRKCKIVFLSVAAVAISVALLVVVSSLFTGFIQSFGDIASQVMGDVLIIPPRPLPQSDTLIQRLEALPEVQAAAASLYVPGLLRLGTGNVRQVEVWGIDPTAMARATGLKGFLDQQRTNAHLKLKKDEGGLLDGYVGIGLLVDPNDITDQYDWPKARAQLGHHMLLFTGSQADGHTAAAPQTLERQTVHLTLRDIVFSGFSLIDSKVVFLPLQPLYRQLYPRRSETEVDRIHVKLAPGVQSATALGKIRLTWADFAGHDLHWGQGLIGTTDIITARAMWSEYLQEVSKQMDILLAVFGLVDVAVVFLVFCIFWLIVGLKRKDIAVIKSCGATGLTVAGIFLGFGALVGLVGALVGVGLGWIFIHNINAIEQALCRILGFNLWNSSLYVLHEIPHRFDPSGAADIALVAIAAACLGALVPAIAAAWTRPVRILRYE